jgi:hypothetical protein
LFRLGIPKVWAGDLGERRNCDNGASPKGCHQGAAEDIAAKDTVAEDIVAKDTVAEDIAAEDTAAEDMEAEDIAIIN